MLSQKISVGFIGQGWIGKNYADDFEARGYKVTRYSLEEAYIQNKDKIALCDIVFIAVPTPTTKEGFDCSLVESVLPLVGSGKIAVIKSTLEPGTTVKLQTIFQDIRVLHSPEFLTEKTATYDAQHPQRNIIGIPIQDDNYVNAAKKVLSVLPDAPYQKVMSATDAEIVKYAGNCFLFTKVLFTNLLYDLVDAQCANWENVREAFTQDARIGASHTEPFSSSRDGSVTGRGAGGHCLIKDFEVFTRIYKQTVGDVHGLSILEAMVRKNMELLIDSKKDVDLLQQVYGTVGGREK